jgi:hypothetical protein
MQLGKRTSIDPSSQCFPEPMEAVVRFVADALSLLELHHLPTVRMRSLPLSDAQVRQLMETLRPLSWLLQVGDQTHTIRGYTAGLPPLTFHMKDDDGVLSLRTEDKQSHRPIDAEGRYIFSGGVVYTPYEAERAVIMPFLSSRTPGEHHFTGAQRERVIGEVLPRLRGAAHVDFDAKLMERVIQEPLSARATLDYEEGEVTCRLQFGYGAHSIDPFAPEPAGKADGPILERDAAMERAILDVLSRHGFRVRTGCAYLSGDEGLYAFLTDGVPALQALCEVYSSKSLLTLRPRRVRPGGRLSAGSGMLEFRLMLEGVEPMDHEAVLGALRDHKEYVRLADGAFLSLTQDEGWTQLAAYLDEAGGEMEEGVLRMERYRAAYLDALLSASGMRVERDEAVRRIATALQDPQDDEPPIPGMRPYQRRGFAWLCTLAQLGMGGILADDMGLGKTLQVLALVEWGHRRGGTKPTLVVSPTTLTYHWLDEVGKFAPHLKAVVLAGTAKARREQAAEAAEYDLVIMSYAQARRDAQEMQEIDFRYVVLDEAQNIKNAQSVGANSVKLFRAEAKFALTGTPMENHPGELWSLFDFVLPGYLGTQEQFMRRFGSGENAADLSARIRPFLMRRLKRDVLRDLPAKLEQRITAEFTPRQREVYRATLSRTREELDEALRQEGGFARSRFKVLAAITRLRQICCHPALYLPGYEGGSGKLELLMELVRDALDADHRILLFSQFTSMLGIIGEELRKAEIDYFYLDGKVPAQERMDMAARFNALEKPIFMISLRAGGTGLNLTAADTVIHYDPWWNPAVEDQATDRAHRIGQDKVVQVFKLVARDTIEEKVFELKGKKQEWIDRIVTPGETLPTQLTPQEILSIFE